MFVSRQHGYKCTLLPRSQTQTLIIYKVYKLSKVYNLFRNTHIIYKEVPLCQIITITVNTDYYGMFNFFANKIVSMIHKLT